MSSRCHAGEDTGCFGVISSRAARSARSARHSSQRPIAAAATATIHATRPRARRRRDGDAGEHRREEREEGPERAALRGRPTRRKATRRRGGATLDAEPRGVAQLVEHRSPKPEVAGSSPVAPVGLDQAGSRPDSGAFFMVMLHVSTFAPGALGNRWNRDTTGAMVVVILVRAGPLPAGPSPSRAESGRARERLRRGDTLPARDGDVLRPDARSPRTAVRERRGLRRPPTRTGARSGFRPSRLFGSCGSASAEG